MNLKTRIRSAALRRFSSAEYLEKQRGKARKRRERQGIPPTVHYFHQVDDPYSHLAVQKLDQLQARYDLPFQPHLVSIPEAEYQGDARHFNQWARRDAASVAADYGAEFAPTVDTLPEQAVAAANQLLAAHLDQADFASIASATGHAFWSEQPVGSTGSVDGGERAVREGNAKRRALGHYQGAMFHFDGEWFWGIDRIRLLEQRLSAEGFDTEPGPLCVPEPAPLDTNRKNPDGVLLEYFPSLRSPYTAIGHQRVLDLVSRSGVSVQVRPVLPMMMRGIPAPREKQRYIIGDAGREGREHGVPFGRIVDPFGEPVKRAFALFPAANALGFGMEFVTAYLNGAWFEGIDITTRQGLEQVVANSGLDWQVLLKTSQDEDWEAVLADNLNALTRESLWGVPSFRVSGSLARIRHQLPAADADALALRGRAPSSRFDVLSSTPASSSGPRDQAGRRLDALTTKVGDGCGLASEPYACWGQDRIWRVANEIARRT